MRKTAILFILIMALLTLLSVTAAAETIDYSRMSFALPDVRSRAASALTVSCKQAPKLGGEGVWQVSATGSVDASGGYVFQLAEVASASNGTIYLEAAFYTEPGGDTFRYTFHDTKTYYMSVSALNSSGSVTCSSGFEQVCEITAVSGVESVDSRIRALVKQAKSAGSDDYSVALWLHDWITEHSVYDETLCRHGADNILFENTGVCDSYSKLYMRMLNAAGIPCVRCLGSVSSGGHAWNQACLDGSWCHIDPTFDDPVFSGVTSMVSGGEHHDYFGMNDEMISADHFYSSDIPCTSLDNLYTYRSGEYRFWLYHVMDEVDASVAAGTFCGAVDTQGWIIAEVKDGTVTSVYTDEYAAAYVRKHMAVAVLCLEQENWQIGGAIAAPLQFAYDESTHTLSWDCDMSGHTLVLPAGLERVAQSAFANGSFWCVELGENVAEVGANAFANCKSLMKVIVRASNVRFDSSSFSGCPEFMVYDYQN